MTSESSTFVKKLKQLGELLEHKSFTDSSLVLTDKQNMFNRAEMVHVTQVMKERGIKVEETFREVGEGYGEHKEYTYTFSW